MNTLHTQTTKQAGVLTRRLFKLERCGRYDDALEDLADIWPSFELQPKIDEFAAQDAAEILLRCGSLIGQHGHNTQIPDAQARSKDLLSNARDRFLKLVIYEKAAECESHLAFAFWRTGEFNEADNWIEEASGRGLPISSDARLCSLVIKSLIDLSCKRYDQIVEKGAVVESDFRTYADSFLTGGFYINLATAYKNLGDIQKALGFYELAKYYHQQSGHKIYLGTVENNLSQLYRETAKFGKAHEAIDNSTKIFKQVKDKTREGYSLDTKALVYFAESKYNDALTTINKALSILRDSENSAYRVDALLTKAKILLYLDNFSDAVLNLSEAVSITRGQAGDKAAIRLIQEFESAMDARNAPPKKNVETDDFELILPPSIAHFTDYRGIWINSTRLESIGLIKGSLAVVARANVDRGDLVAVSEVESDEVSCGFYDSDFGIVCIEGTEGEPQIFDEKEVRVLGKIVGVCNTGRNEDGKMVVESLNL